MVHQDIVCCDSCGDDVIHLIVDGNVPNDPNYRMCDACLASRKEDRLAEREARDYADPRGQQAHGWFGN